MISLTENLNLSSSYTQCNSNQKLEKQTGILVFKRDCDYKTVPQYLLNGLNGVKILQQLFHDYRLELFKALHCLTHKQQNIKCCLFSGITQELH